MDNTMHDIFIIGGGINGVGIAADAASRGLSVVLCEKDDLANATSSASTKLIHGGLRYLENYDFGLVRKALKERELLLKLAPHLVHPLQFISPYESHLRPAWLIRLGLFIYDHLIAKHSMPRAEKINLRDIQHHLKKDFTSGFSFYDCATDDARLVITNAIAAQQNGAIILSRHTFVHASYKNNYWEIKIKNNISQEINIYKSKVLVNAAGPWVADIHKNILPTENFAFKFVKGSHIIVPSLYAGDFAYLLQNKDKRIVFVIPYHENFSLIGTTDVELDSDLNHIHINDEEKNYLCKIVNQYFEKQITPSDILFSYAGVRTLQFDATKKLSDITRDYKFELHQSFPLLTVISGKLTTYRRLAKECVDSLHAYFPGIKPSRTDEIILPGGEFPQGSFAAFLKSLKNEFSFLPESLVARYAKSYGMCAYRILKDVRSVENLGEDFSHTLYQKEIEYLIQYEWAQTAEDVLWRRSKLGLYFSQEQVERLSSLFNKYF